MTDDFFSMIVEAGLDYGDPQAFSTRADLMARKVSSVAHGMWACEGRALPDPAPIESLLAAYNNLYLAGVENWRSDERGEARVFSIDDDRRYLLRCFEEAHWELALVLRSAKRPNAILIYVEMELSNLIARLKRDEWKQS